MTIAPLVVSRRTRNCEGLALLWATRLAPHSKSAAAIRAIIRHIVGDLLAIAPAVHPPGGLVDLLPPALHVRGERLVVPPLLVGRLAHEPVVIVEPVGIEISGVDRRPDRAPRLAVVRTVRE